MPGAARVAHHLADGPGQVEEAERVALVEPGALSAPFEIIDPADGYEAPKARIGDHHQHEQHRGAARQGQQEGEHRRGQQADRTGSRQPARSDQRPTTGLDRALRPLPPAGRPRRRPHRSRRGGRAAVARAPQACRRAARQAGEPHARQEARIAQGRPEGAEPVAPARVGGGACSIRVRQTRTRPARPPARRRAAGWSGSRRCRAPVPSSPPAMAAASAVPISSARRLPWRARSATPARRPRTPRRRPPAGSGRHRAGPQVREAERHARHDHQREARPPPSGARRCVWRASPRDGREQRAGGVGSGEQAGRRLAQVEVVRVVGQERRDRPVEHRVHEHDRCNEHNEPAHRGDASGSRLRASRRFAPVAA